MGSGRKQLGIRVEAEDSISIVRLAGSIDAANLSDFENILESVCSGSRPRVLLDCHKLAYVNSTSYDLLFHFHRICKTHRGRLGLFGVPKKIMPILKLLGLDSILSLFSTKAEALTALRKPAR
ncbi:MAG: STAS domain-containing protein [Lentisphaerota bacterium]